MTISSPKRAIFQGLPDLPQFLPYRLPLTSPWLALTLQKAPIRTDRMLTALLDMILKEWIP
jgi:hypothetical protein